jgi:hypothetical protein
MIDIQKRVRDAKPRELLRRVVEVSGADRGRYVPVGDLGAELGLPYGEAIELADELHAAGLVHRVGDLAPPHGPRVHVTPRGLRTAKPTAA